MNARFHTSPSFPLYVDDFVSGTSDMTAKDVGVYFRLLCYQWNRGGIPEKTGKMNRIAGAEISLDVLSKFTLCADGLRRNARLELERKKQADYAESQRKKGIKSGMSRRERALNALNPGSTGVEPTGEPNSNRTRTQGEPPFPIPHSPFPLGRDGFRPEPIVEFPESFPKNPEEAVAWASSIGAPEDFIRATWDKAASRCGCEYGSTVPIAHWTRYVSSAWTRQRSEWRKAKSVNGQAKSFRLTDAQLKALQDKIDIHPANQTSVMHHPDRTTDAMRADFKALRDQLAKLTGINIE